MCKQTLNEWRPQTNNCRAYYGLSLNNTVILSAIGYSGGTTVYKILLNTAVGNLIIVCAGAIPGYWVTVATVDIIGRKPIQLGGFVILTIIFIVMGFAYHKLSSHGLLALYVVAQFFFNFVRISSSHPWNQANSLQTGSQCNNIHCTG
jgi:hypothetical protein